LYDKIEGVNFCQASTKITIGTGLYGVIDVLKLVCRFGAVLR